jgi:3-oxoacyl-[acyl-carrier protein] reductase
MTETLQNKIAVVTGGTKGIGLSIASALLEEGARVVLAARQEREVAAFAQQLEQCAPGRVEGVVCDVRDYSQVQALMQRAGGRWGGIDFLINNAGVGIFASIEELTPEQWRKVIDTNLTGVFNCCHAAIPWMKKQGAGYIINISSLAGKNPLKGGAAYNASKFGLNGFSEAIMQDLRYDNIRVSYVMPGSVNTYFNGKTPDPEAQWKLQPEDVARVVIDLLRHDPRCLPSCVEMRPSKPPRK